MLSESTIKQLEDYSKWQNAYKLVNKKRWKGTDDRIFTARDGSYMFPGTCEHILRKIEKNIIYTLYVFMN